VGLPLLLLLLTAARAEPGPELLVNGGFEQGGALPTAWHLVPGATVPGSGHSRVKRVREQDGNAVVRLTGAAGTARWDSLDSDPVPVTPGTLLELRGRMRTEGVRVEGHQYANCDLALMFTDAQGAVVRVGGSPVVATPVLRGDQPWAALDRVVTVPPGATTVTVLAFLSMSGTSWVDDLSLRIASPPDWVRAETKHYLFLSSQPAPVSAQDQARNEEIYARMSATLGVDLPFKVTYHRYATPAEKGAWTGDAGNGHAQGDRDLYTVWPIDDHEIVHLLARQWGETDSPLLGEGLAVALSGSWLGRPPDAWVAELKAQGKVPDLASLVDGARFRSMDDRVSYALAGSFVDFFIQLWGIDRFHLVYTGTDPLPARLQRETGMDLDQLRAAWLEGLGEAP